MPPDFSIADRTLGVVSGMTVAILCLVYVAVLSIGLITLPSQDSPIQQPWFPLMEILILGVAPAMVALTIALHAWVPAGRKALALASVAFMTMAAVVTSGVHFSILALGRQPGFESAEWVRQVFAFEWPSVVYALDVLAWDVLFPLSVLFAAFALPRDDRVLTIRWLLFASSALAFSGLAGVVLADMRIRNIGIIGYAIVFPLAAGLLARLFRSPYSHGWATPE